MKAYIGVAESPAGGISFAVNEVGDLVYTSFAEGKYPVSMRDELTSRGYEIEEDGRRTESARRELEEYAAGERRDFGLGVSPVGTEWQLKVWDALRRIPFGETRTYSQIAAMIGHPRAARAVGRANATNRIPLVVPCHRVVGADGKLTGFAGGVHLKEKLLAHEQNVMFGAA